MTDISERIAAYLLYRMPEAQGVAVTSVSRIFGGASCETYRVRAQWREGANQVEKGLVFRRDPEFGLIETNRSTEFAVYRAFQGVIPVPGAIYLEEDPKWLDRAFFVMDEIQNCTAVNPFLPSPFGVHAEKVGKQFFGHLGTIARQDPGQLGLSSVLPDVAPDMLWKRELDYWEKMIDEDAQTPQPIVKAATRWLRNNPPPPPKKLCVVHGDYRSANFLFDSAGEIQGILDWEMAHIGDPLEDLAWATDPIWIPPNTTLAGAMIDMDEAYRIWEEASGIKIDPDGLRWWGLFSQVKAMAAWISAGTEYGAGRNTDPILAFPAWLCASAHNLIIAHKLSTWHEAKA